MPCFISVTDKVLSCRLYCNLNFVKKLWLCCF